MAGDGVGEEGKDFRCNFRDYGTWSDILLQAISVEHKTVVLLKVCSIRILLLRGPIETHFLTSCTENCLLFTTVNLLEWVILMADIIITGVFGIKSL